MGELADTAKKNSNFFKIEKGESAVVTYLGVRIIPSSQDPNKDVAQYKLATEYGDKFWTNGNTAIMMFFDELPVGSKVKISRGKWLNKDKTEDTSKSTYTVSTLDAQGEVSAAPEQAKKVVKKLDTDQQVINPEDIAWQE